MKLQSVSQSRCPEGSNKVREKQISHILEMLNYYSDTFARLSLTDLNDVGEIGVTLISSILKYRVSVLLIESDNKEPELLAGKRYSGHRFDPDLVSRFMQIVEDVNI